MSCRVHDQQQDTKVVTSGRKLPPVVPSVDSAGCSTLSMRVMRATPAALMSYGRAPGCVLSNELRSWLQLLLWRLVLWVEPDICAFISVCDVQCARHSQSTSLHLTAGSERVPASVVGCAP